MMRCEWKTLESWDGWVGGVVMMYIQLDSDRIETK